MAKKKDEKKTGPPTLHNRKARHEFQIEDVFEAGVELMGTEVKSLRAGHAGFTDSFAFIQNGEIFLKDFYIKEFEQGSYNNHESKRDRKLLLNKKEIAKIDKAIGQKGMTLVPLKLYFKRGWVKIQLGLAKGKKVYDKRADIAKRDTQRDLDRQIKGQFNI